MISRLTPRSAACLLALPLFGALATASIRLDMAAQEIVAAPPQAATLAAAGMDIPALTATAGEDSLPLVAVRDPI